MSDCPQSYSLDGSPLHPGLFILPLRNHRPQTAHAGHYPRIIVYSPQIYENYALQSGEGLSIVFVYIWLLGDLCNLVGAGLAGLLPTVIILAVYVRPMSFTSQIAFKIQASSQVHCVRYHTTGASLLLPREGRTQSVQ